MCNCLDSSCNRRRVASRLAIVLQLAVLIAPASPRLCTAEELEQPEWQSLFDGKTLDGWKKTEFGGEGDIVIENEEIRLGFGSPLTGLTYAKEPPRTNYEIRLEAQRIEGTDFFCGLTFPVGEHHCSLILGGWGGALVGLSSIDGVDASENDTQQIIAFERKKWYRIRVRVTESEIECWLDDQRIIQQPLAGHEISIRPEVNRSRPLGICSFDTLAGLRKLEIRSLVNNVKVSGAGKE